MLVTSPRHHIPHLKTKNHAGGYIPLQNRRTATDSNGTATAATKQTAAAILNGNQQPALKPQGDILTDFLNQSHAKTKRKHCLTGYAAFIRIKISRP